MNIRKSEMAALQSILVLFCVFQSFSAFSQDAITKLQVNYLTEPLGIDLETPRFSWQMVLDAELHDQYQTAYQIKVYNESDDLVWDSGKVASDISLAIPYAGEVLQPMT